MAALAQLAKDTDRSMSYLVRMAVARYLKAQR